MVKLPAMEQFPMRRQEYAAPWRIHPFGVYGSEGLAFRVKGIVLVPSLTLNLNPKP